jgi:hypothetical protein
MLKCLYVYPCPHLHFYALLCGYKPLSWYLILFNSGQLLDIFSSLKNDVSDSYIKGTLWGQEQAGGRRGKGKSERD